jgi:hypothetical protein
MKLIFFCMAGWESFNIPHALIFLHTISGRRTVKGGVLLFPFFKCGLLLFIGF